MSKDDELARERAANLLAQTTVFVRDQPGILPAAAPDLARRLVEKGAELRRDNTIRMNHGGDLSDELHALRAVVPTYFLDPAQPVPEQTPPPAPAARTAAPPKNRRAEAMARLAKANGDQEPRL